MKNVFVFTIGLVISIASYAQDASYGGVAKMYVKSFWSQAELLKSGKGGASTVGNMKRALDNARQKDPALNATDMEATLKKWQAEFDKQEDAGKSPDQKNADAKSAGYAGAAKSQVKYFWERAVVPLDNLSEGEVNRNIKDMDYALKATKEKDPAYNASEMESTLLQIKEKFKQQRLAEVRGFSGDRSKAPQTDDTPGNDPVKLMEKLFIDNNISVGSTEDIPQAPGKIAAYRAKLDKLLTLDYTNALIKVGKNAKGNIGGMKTVTERELDKAGRLFEEVGDKTGMEYMYYTVQYHQAFWEAALKIFPEESSYQEELKKVKAAAAKIGTLEQLYAKAEANRIEKIRNTKMPAPVVKDAGLENILMNGFNKKYGAQYNGTALKVVLTQDGWTIERNKISGVVTGRNRTGKLAYKGKDGKCYLLANQIFIYQAFIGGSFSNTEVVYNSLGGMEMLCENVK
jgi:hypothetical protein